MKKLFRYTMFQIKSSMVNIARHFGLAISAAFSVCISLIIVAVFALLTSNLNYMSENIASELSMRVSIDPVITEETLTQLQTDIKNIDGVIDVDYRSKDQELAAYKKEYKSSEQLFSMYEGESNPITDALVIKVDDAKKLQTISIKLSIMDGILKVSDGGTMTQQLLQLFDVIRYGGGFAVLVLLLIAIFLISNKIKMSIYTRKDEVAIMRFVGAGNWFIRIPMMLEGLLIGIMGAIPAAILTLVGYYKLYHAMGGILMSDMLVLQPTMPLASSLAILIVICGMAVGILGSLFSTSRYLKWKR